MDKCSCGYMEFAKFLIDSSKCIFGTTLSANKIWICAETQNIVSQSCYFCPRCGDQLLPDGRVIQRETTPNKLMTMLREVQANCPEAGLQEFALKVFNWIEEMREQAGLTERELAEKADVYPSYPLEFVECPGDIYFNMLFRLLNAAKQEATDGV